MILNNEDCIVQMQKMIDEGIQVDSVVTDPPYELGFMGKSWDSTGIAFQKETWELTFQLLKPGGHLLAFAGSRTYHRIAVAIEDAGFEIRDQIMWLYGSGFPKSLNVSKAIDSKKLTGKSNSVSLSASEKNRPVVGKVKRVVSSDRVASDGEGEHGVPANMERFHNYEQKDIPVTGPSTEEAKQWEGWGTALKPAHEPVVMARKPVEGTVAENVLKHGTGGINIDECRIGTEKVGARKSNSDGITRRNLKFGMKEFEGNETEGRFPANVMHDGSEEVLEGFPYTKSGKMKQHIKGGQYNVYGKMYPRDVETIGDEGSAARFFYCPKVSKSERNRGLDKNNHPTVKPIELMKYLCRLVTPKGGTVLDPFMGSGSTGMAAKDEGFDFIGIEKEKEYFEIAEQRINSSSPLFDFL